MTLFATDGSVLKQWSYDVTGDSNVSHGTYPTWASQPTSVPRGFFKQWSHRVGNGAMVGVASSVSATELTRKGRRAHTKVAYRWYVGDALVKHGQAKRDRHYAPRSSQVGEALSVQVVVRHKGYTSRVEVRRFGTVAAARTSPGPINVDGGK